MKQNELSPLPGSRRARRRVGRGSGSRRGDYSGRGMKGQKSRSGHRIGRAFEGGQLPLIKRLPYKRGFTNNFRTEYSLVNLARLSSLAQEEEITPELLLRRGIIKSSTRPVKVLGQGEVDRPLRIKAHKFSESAKIKIEAAGGKAEEI